MFLLQPYPDSLGSVIDTAQVMLHRLLQLTLPTYGSKVGWNLTPTGHSQQSAGLIGLLQKLTDMRKCEKLNLES